MLIADKASDDRDIPIVSTIAVKASRKTTEGQPHSLSAEASQKCMETILTQAERSLTHSHTRYCDFSWLTVLEGKISVL